MKGEIIREYLIGAETYGGIQVSFPREFWIKIASYHSSNPPQSMFYASCSLFSDESKEIVGVEFVLADGVRHILTPLHPSYVKGVGFEDGKIPAVIGYNMVNVSGYPIAKVEPVGE